MMGKKYDVVALGELLVDFTPAGSSSGNMRLFEQNAGGAPVNMLTAVAKNGYRTAFIGKVGKDMHGEFLKKTVEAVGIDTEGLVMAEDVFTTLAFVALDEKGERTFSFARKPGADTQLCYKELKMDLLKETHIFHVGSLSLTDEPARTTTFQAVRTAKEAGALISYDPNYRKPLWESREEAVERMRSMLTYADMVKLSAEETDMLTPYTEPEDAAVYLLKKGPVLAVVTLGEEGALVATTKVMFHVSGFHSHVVDTTGAGDAFWGGFLSAFLRTNKSLTELSGEELTACALYGNAEASLCVERRGGIPGIPKQEEVEQRLEAMSLLSK